MELRLSHTEAEKSSYRTKSLQQFFIAATILSTVECRTNDFITLFRNIFCSFMCSVQGHMNVGCKDCSHSDHNTVISFAGRIPLHGTQVVKGWPLVFLDGFTHRYWGFSHQRQTIQPQHENVEWRLISPGKVVGKILKFRAAYLNELMRSGRVGDEIYCTTTIWNHYLYDGSCLLLMLILLVDRQLLEIEAIYHRRFLSLFLCTGDSIAT